ncbi:unnamed protein product, partial [Heterotrigona itama]
MAFAKPSRRPSVSFSAAPVRSARQLRTKPTTLLNKITFAAGDTPPVVDNYEWWRFRILNCDERIWRETEFRDLGTGPVERGTVEKPIEITGKILVRTEAYLTPCPKQFLINTFAPGNFSTSLEVKAALGGISPKLPPRVSSVTYRK